MHPLTFCRTGMAAVAGLAGLVLGAAWAQPVPQAPAPTSAVQPSTQPALPELPYSSVFTRYQGFAAQPVTPWGTTSASAKQGHSHHDQADMAQPADAADNRSGGRTAPPSQPIPQGNHSNHGSQQ